MAVATVRPVRRLQPGNSVPLPRGRTLSSSSSRAKEPASSSSLTGDKSMGGKVYNTKIMPFVKAFVEAVEASYPTSVSVSSMPQTGVVIYPRYNSAGQATTVR